MNIAPEYPWLEDANVPFGLRPIFRAFSVSFREDRWMEILVFRTRWMDTGMSMALSKWMITRVSVGCQVP